MRKRLRITVLMDSACVPDEDPEFTTGLAEESTEHHVVNSLRNRGYQVSVQELGSDPAGFISRLVENKPDLVFNLTEEFRGNRLMDRNITAILEMMGIPFTGAGSAGLMLCRAKGLCKQLLNLHKIRVPDFLILPPCKKIRCPKNASFPMVVKPVYGDGSDGISNASLVKDRSSLEERAKMIHARWKQPAIAEEFIEGRELYVGVLGNRRLTVLPPRELFFNGTEKSDGPVLATYRVKWDTAYQKKWNIRFGFAELEDKVFRKISRVCRKIYRTLQIQDYGRLDIRLTPDEQIVVMEANANPDVAFGEELAESAEKAGISYDDFIDRVVRSALRRHKSP